MIAAISASLALPFAVVIILLIWWRRSLVLVTVSGASMEPTYSDGDRVLVLKRHLKRINVGQVVVFSVPPAGNSADVEISIEEVITSRTIETTGAFDLGERDSLAIKRAVALPGDEYSGREIPSGHLAVEGDNRSLSTDSRHYGYISGEHLIGVAIHTLHA